MIEEFFGVWNLGTQLMNCIHSALRLKQKITDSAHNSTKSNTKENDMSTETSRGLIERRQEPPTPPSQSTEPETNVSDNTTGVESEIQLQGLIQRRKKPPASPSRSVEPETNVSDNTTGVESEIQSRGLIQRRQEPIPRRPPRKK